MTERASEESADEQSPPLISSPERPPMPVGFSLLPPGRNQERHLQPPPPPRCSGRPQPPPPEPQRRPGRPQPPPPEKPRRPGRPQPPQPPPPEKQRRPARNQERRLQPQPYNVPGESERPNTSDESGLEVEEANKKAKDESKVSSIVCGLCFCSRHVEK